jgi:RNA polymerase sigma factor (sigma-70 family)
MNPDRKRLEVADGRAEHVEHIVHELQTAYLAMSSWFAAEVRPSERLDSIVRSAQHDRPRVPSRPRRRPRTMAVLRRSGAAIWARVEAAAGALAMMSNDSGPSAERDGAGEQWLDQLFRDHWTAVARYLSRQIDNRSDIEDLTQQTFMAAWRQRSQLNGEPRAWLFGIARNLARAYWRGRHRDYRMWQRQVMAAPPSTDGGILASELEVTVAAAWRRLSPKERECLLLSLDHGLDDGAIASYLRTSRETVRQRRHRARWKLYDAIDGLPQGRATDRLSRG